MRLTLRLFPLALVPLLACCTQAQQPASADVSPAVTGRWTGVLEYRDYSEPATSQKRVTLPTWLTITGTAGAEAWHYIYDDGPGKVVDEDEQFTFDADGSRCTVTPKGKASQTFQVAGLASMKAGRGTLVLTGPGTDNGKPSERRMTLTVGRNLLTLLEEVRAAGTQDEFAYRHLYRFVRAEPPAVTEPK